MEIIIRNHKSSVLFSSVPTGTLCTRFLFCTPTRDMKILIYELLNMYIVTEDHYKWSYILSVFPLSYKLSTGVLSM